MARATNTDIIEKLECMEVRLPNGELQQIQEDIRDIKEILLDPEDGLVVRVNKNTYWRKQVDVDDIKELKNFLDKNNNLVKVGKIEKMSKSKKNTIDPTNIIDLYGTDTARWFMLSDSPPERDLEWTDTGVAASNKFIKKLWDLTIKTKNYKRC